MLYLPNDIASYTDEELHTYVRMCDDVFNTEFAKIAAELCADKDFKLLGLSGPTCAGKTTAAKKLVYEFGQLGRRTHIVSIDDFYYDKAVMEKISEESGEEVDFESIKSIDLELLRKCVAELFDKGFSNFPKFDFKTGKRCGFERLCPDKNDVIIFEGIQVIYPEVMELFSRYHFKTLFICASSEIFAGGEVFVPNEIRLLRRAVRDVKHRNSPVEYTLELWHTVRANEEKNIFPFMDRFDYKIDSSMAYELCILTPKLRALLPTIPDEGEAGEFKKTIIDKMSDIYCVSDEYIEPDSLYMEFI